MIWRTLAKVAGYAAFFIGALLFFLYVTFPMDQVRGYVEYQAQKKLKMDVRIGDFDLKGLSGIEMWDVVVVLPEKKAEAEAPDEVAPPGPPTMRPGAPAKAALPGADEEAEEAPVRFKPTKRPGVPAAEAEAKGAPKAKAGKKPAADAKAAAAEEPATEDAAEGDDAKKGKKNKGLAVKIDHVDIEVDVVDVLFGKSPEVRVDAELYGGSINDMRIARDGKKVHIEAKEISALDLTKSGLLGYFLPFDVRGKLAGSADFTWGGTLYDSKGTIELALSQSVIREPALKSKAYGEFVLTNLKTGTLAVKVVVGKKKDFPVLRAAPGPKEATIIHLEKVEASGEDAELLLDERSVFVLRKGKPFGDASMNLELAFSLTDAFFDREVVRKGEKEKPNKFLKYLMDHDARWKKAEKNGYYGMRCTGIVKGRDCKPMRPTMRVGFARPATEEPAEDKVEEKGGKAEDKGPKKGSVQSPTRAKPGPSTTQKADVPTERPTVRTVQDIARERAAAPQREGRVSPEDRIEQLRKERDERLRKLREARGIPTEQPATIVDEEPIDDLDDPLLDEELPLDDLDLEEGAVDEVPLDEDHGGELVPEEELPAEELPAEEGY